MASGILVNGSYRDNGFVSSLVVGLIAIVPGVLIAAYTDQAILGTFILSVGALLLGVAIIRYFQLTSRRIRLEDLEDGFAVTTARGRFEFGDERVTDLATYVAAKFANGVPKGAQRNGMVQIDADEVPGTIPIAYDWGMNKPDPLFDLFSRWLDRLTATAFADIESGGELVGEGWAYGREGLEIDGAKDDEGPLQLERIAAVDIVDGHVCIWAKGDDLPGFKTKLGTKNAAILFGVLAKQLAERPPEADDGSGEGLGRIIFERNQSWSPGAIVAGFTLGVGAFLGGLALVYVSLTDKGADGVPVWVGIVVCIVGLIMPLTAWFSRIKVFRCQARGVYQNINGKEVSMRFEDVRSFTYSATRHYYNGAYTGTMVLLKFESDDGAKLDYNAQFKNADDELDNLRDHVSRVIAGGMKRRIDAGKKIYWTDRVTFEPDGLDISGKKGLFGTAEDRFLEWSEIADVGMNAGQFALFAKGQKKAVYETPVSTPNFFPGFYLILAIRFPAEEPEVEGTDPRRDSVG